jgi:hypothetical protein
MSITSEPWKIYGNYVGPEKYHGMIHVVPSYLLHERDKKELLDTISAVPALLALARRVHAECGRVEVHTNKFTGAGYNQCNLCLAVSQGDDEIVHKPDCLWLAAARLCSPEPEAMKKEGLI